MLFKCAIVLYPAEEITASCQVFSHSNDWVNQLIASLIRSELKSNDWKYPENELKI